MLKAVLGINRYPDFNIIKFDLEQELNKLTDEEKVDLDNIINSDENFDEDKVKYYLWDLQENKMLEKTILDPKKDYKFWNNPLMLLSALQTEDMEKLLHQHSLLARMLSGTITEKDYPFQSILPTFKQLIRHGAECDKIWLILQQSKKHFEEQKNQKMVEQHENMEKQFIQLIKEESPYFQYVKEAEKVATCNDLQSEKGKILILCFLKLTQKYDFNVLNSFIDFFKNCEQLNKDFSIKKLQTVIENAMKIANKKSCQ